MKIIVINILKILRKLYSKVVITNSSERLTCEEDPSLASEVIINALMGEEPCMIARFGANELSCVVNYLGVKHNKKLFLGFIQGKSPAWWWEKEIVKNMNVNAGFFPPSIDSLEKFSELMIKDISELDILGSWQEKEEFFKDDLEHIKRISFIFLDPFWSDNPWTIALKGKKVLVIHPFVETIKEQYKKRELLFKGDFLPEFELKTIKAVQSMAGEETDFANWFEALEYMKMEIDKEDFDICLIGAGAYGFPLAAHIKRIGKKAFHLGGSLQLLFGIRGSRWENNYNTKFDYTSIINKHWVRPNSEEKPKCAELVENACYW